jgi:hypothetical protein
LFIAQHGLAHTFSLTCRRENQKAQNSVYAVVRSLGLPFPLPQ